MNVSSMRWRIELREVTGGRRLLADVLRELSMALVEVNGALFLTGERLETLETPSDAYEYASKLQEVVRQVCYRAPRIGLGFSLGGVVEASADGGERRHYFLEVHDSVHLHEAAQVELLIATSAENVSDEERQCLDAERAEQEYQRLRRIAVCRIVSAVADDRALTVQRLLSGELTPLSLGHVADLIQDELLRLV